MASYDALMDEGGQLRACQWFAEAQAWGSFCWTAYPAHGEQLVGIAASTTDY